MKRMTLALISFALGFSGAGLRAQTPAPAAPSADAQPEAQDSRSIPPPGDDVMRPTELGLRLNRKMARGLSAMWMINNNFWRDVDLSDEQIRQLSDATSRRMMDMSHRNGKEYRDSIEFLMETLLSTGGHPEKISPERTREFAQKVLPLTRGGREFFAGVLEDARSCLNEQQMEQLKKSVDRELGRVEKFETRMRRWSEGGFQEGENPFEGLDDDGSDRKNPDESRAGQQRRQARRTAEWDLRRLSGWEWNQILNGFALMFKFDAAQRAKGEAVLARYRKKADAIMTPAWREKITRNRILYNAQWQLGDLPRGPWLWQLESEYNAATRPLRELTPELTKEILAIPTNEQRAAALDTIRATAAKHGLAFEDADLALLWMAAP